MSLPIRTHDLAMQLEQAKGDQIESWLRGMQEQPGNPFGAYVLQIGNIRAFAVCNLQEIGLFNQVIGLGPQEKESLHEVMQFYRDHGIEQYRLEINPYHASPDFLTYLAAYSFQQSNFEAYLYGLMPLDISSSLTDVTIHTITSSELDLFADIHVEGFREALSHLSEKTRRLYRECTKVLYQRSGWHLYLAQVNGIPSGMGMLYIQSGRALLAGGATIPHMRQQGCQTALLHHRFLAATHAQCSLIVGQTSVGSISQKNMERIGMRIAYTATMNTLNHFSY